ncbi:MAG TPA: hypothetical protein VFG64_10020 [Dongiaceae bacterium]|nr:hypothetical protein [Dongiaceae bacterium]
MSPLFKLLGVAVLLYAAHAAVSGRVYARSGPGGRTISRRSSPRSFWTVIAIYAGLGLALLTMF